MRLTGLLGRATIPFERPSPERNPGKEWCPRVSELVNWGQRACPTVAYSGVHHAAYRVPSLWPADFRRSRSLPSVRSSQSANCPSSGGPEVLRMRRLCYHKVPELRRAELRDASAVHLCRARARRGLRTPLRALLRISDDLEGSRLGFRRNYPPCWIGHFCVLCRAALATKGNIHPFSSTIEGA